MFDQGSAIAYIGAALQALANRQDQLVQALRPALTWAAGGAPVEQLLPCAPQAAAAAAGADGRPPAARPTLSSDEAGLAAEQFDDLKLEEQVEVGRGGMRTCMAVVAYKGIQGAWLRSVSLQPSTPFILRLPPQLTFQLLGSGELPLQATAGGRQPTPAEISKQKGSQRGELSGWRGAACCLTRRAACAHSAVVPSCDALPCAQPTATACMKLTAIITCLPRPCAMHLVLSLFRICPRCF